MSIHVFIATLFRVSIFSWRYYTIIMAQARVQTIRCTLIPRIFSVSTYSKSYLYKTKSVTYIGSFWLHILVHLGYIYYMKSHEGIWKKSSIWPDIPRVIPYTTRRSRVVYGVTRGISAKYPEGIARGIFCRYQTRKSSRVKYPIHPEGPVF